MRVLAIDPGETVGLALVDTEKDIMWHAALPLGQAGAAIVSKILLSTPTHIAMETPPAMMINRGKDAWATIQEILKKHAEKGDICRVSPGEWKPLVAILKEGTEKFATQHEKDAVCIARFFLRQAKEMATHADYNFPSHYKARGDRARVGKKEIWAAQE